MGAGSAAPASLRPTLVIFNHVLKALATTAGARAAHTVHQIVDHMDGVGVAPDASTMPYLVTAYYYAGMGLCACKAA